MNSSPLSEGQGPPITPIQKDAKTSESPIVSYLADKDFFNYSRIK